MKVRKQLAGVGSLFLMKIQGRELRLEDSRYHYPLNHPEWF